MKKKPEDATIEEILWDMTNYEDIDSVLIISATENKGALVMEYDGYTNASAATLKEALVELHRKLIEKHPWLLEEGGDGYYELDWR